MTLASPCTANGGMAVNTKLCRYALDGLISHENEELRDRVTSLEKRVEHQEDEILCLKSALSDAIRRIAALENTKGNVCKCSLVHSKHSYTGVHASSRRTVTMTATRCRSPSPLRIVSKPLRVTSPKTGRVFCAWGPPPSYNRARPHPADGSSKPESPPSPMRWQSVDRLSAHPYMLENCYSRAKSVDNLSRISPLTVQRESYCTTRINGHNYDSGPYGHTGSYAEPKVQFANASVTSTTPSKGVVKTPPHKSSVGRPSGGAPHVARRATENRASPSSAKAAASRSLTSPSGKKWGSPSGGSHENMNGVPPSSKDPFFNKDEGTVKMFLKGRPVNMYMPSEAVDYDLSKLGEPPNLKLKLEWCYGYRGRDCRSNVYFLPTGEVIYFVAAVVVLYSVEEQMQRHYLGHNDDVKCLAVHPDRITIASGQVAGHDKVAGKPHVRIWNSVSLATMHIIGFGDFERAVCCVSFSKADQGSYLCVVDEGNEHTLSVWDWQAGEKGRKVTETKSSTEAVLAAEFHPLDKNSIVTCGKSQVTFWSLDNGTLNKKSGIFDKYEKPKFILSLTFAENGDVITGDSNGNLFVWARGTNKVGRALLSAHDGGIFALCMMKDGSMLSGGGRDRKIVHWDADLNKTGAEAELPEHYGPVRTLSQGRGNMILAGTTRNTILQGTLSLEFSPIVQGHLDEVWGLAMHPSQHQFLTCAYDRLIYLWDALTHTVIWQKELSDTAHSACFYPEGDIVAIGSQCGRWFVIDTTSHDVIAVHTDGGEQIECMQFSPDGQYLALGSRDQAVYVYQTNEGGRKYSRVGKCTGHSSFITHLDWSEDSAYIQTNSGDHEILFWTAHNCSPIPSASSMRDVKWKTQTCTFSINTCGIWPEGADGTDVNACCKSTARTNLLASADDLGKVNLFNYPSMKPLSGAHSYGGHSSHVTNVTFLYDDSRLLSTGGRDTAVMQWEII